MANLLHGDIFTLKSICCIIAVVCMQCDQFTVITNSLYGDPFVLKPICCMVDNLLCGCIFTLKSIYCIIAVLCMQCDQFTVITNSLYGDPFVLKPICCMVDNLLCGDSLHLSQFAIWQISYIAANWLHICSVVTRLCTQINFLYVGPLAVWKICCMVTFFVFMLYFLEFVCLISSFKT